MFCKMPWHKIVPGASETASWRATSGNKIMQTDANAMRTYQGRELTTAEIRKIVITQFPDFSTGSLLPNDHAEGNVCPCSCAGTTSRIFDRLDRGLYRVR